MTAQKLSNYNGYYDNERPEIISLIDDNALMILDVGCGHGHLGKSLKQINPNRKVFGIEYHKDIAEIARNNIDDVIIGDVQTIELPFAKQMFDCIIFADVLEHLINPIDVLKKIKPLLRKDGFIICSIPNMRHYSIILRLIMKGWQYDEFGHFDKTHLRFFSLSSMENLIQEAGYEIKKISPRIVMSKKMKLLYLILGRKIEEFVSFQYLIKAKIG